MCRAVAYLGPPVTLDALLLAPEHSLLKQSWAPRFQRHGTVNADGFGAGWYDTARRREPARYRTDRPMWTDRSFASIARVIESSSVLAAVRSATPPAPVEESGVVSDPRLAGVEGASDSELLFALALDALDGGADLGEALAHVVARVEAVSGGRLNFLLTDGERVAATVAGDTLFSLENAGVATGGVVLASEPFDAAPWTELPDRSLVVAEAGGIEISPLPSSGGPL
jgi:glutamine amidotransferase